MNPYARNLWSCPTSTRYARMFRKKTLEKLLTAHAFHNPAVRHSITSSGVLIEEGAVIEDSILFPDVRIGKGAHLRRVIVDEGVEIPAGCEVGFDGGQNQHLYSVTPGGITVVTQKPHTPKRSVVAALASRDITTNYR